MEIKDTFLFAVNAGLVAGHRMVHKAGRNPAASTQLDHIMFGGGILVPLTTAVKMEAISTNTNDTVAGSRARVVKIIGVDNEYNYISEIINMNGTTVTSLTSKKFLRVFRASVLEVGTYNTTNLGDISIRVSGAGATQITIPAGVGGDHTSHFTIPNSETAFLINTRIDVDSSKTANIFLNERSKLNIGGSAPFSPVKHSQTWDAVTGNLDDVFVSGHNYAAGTDIWAESIAGQNNTAVEFDYDLILIKDWVLNA